MADEETIHYGDSDDWLFISDLSISSMCAICNSLLTIIWMRYSYCNHIPNIDNIATPNAQSSESAIDDIDNIDSINDKIEPTMMEIARKRSHTIPFLGRLYMTISILSALVFSYFFVLTSTLFATDILTMNILKNFCPLVVFAVVPNAMNRLFLYLYFLWRIDVSFNATFLEMSKKTVKLLSILAFFAFTFSSFFAFIYVEIMGCVKPLDILIGSAAFVIFDAIFAWLCLYLFVSRLRKVIKMSDAEIDINKDTQKLQYIANKFTILSLVAILCTMIMAFIFFVVPLQSLGGIDTTLNVICLILSTVDYDIYYKRYCVLCTKCCHSAAADINNSPSKMEMVLH